MEWHDIGCESDRLGFLIVVGCYYRITIRSLFGIWVEL